MAGAGDMLTAPPADGTGQAIRCPICLAPLTAPLDTAPDTLVLCGKCRRKFKFVWALPPAGERVNNLEQRMAAAGRSAPSTYEPPEPVAPPPPLSYLLAAAAAVAIVVIAT